MADMGVQIMGLKEAEAHLRAVQQGVARLPFEGNIRVGWNLPYSWGIHYGRRRNGRLARKAGGTFALTNALQRHTPRIKEVVEDALAHDPDSLVARLYGVAMDIRNDAREHTPVVSGELRRNLQIVPSRVPMTRATVRPA